MKIQIFGMGCLKCKNLERNALDALESLAVDAEVEKVSDPAAIAGMGIMMTPALAIDGTVKSAGKVLSKEQIANLIRGEK